MSYIGIWGSGRLIRSLRNKLSFDSENFVAQKTISSLIIDLPMMIALVMRTCWMGQEILHLTQTVDAPCMYIISLPVGLIFPKRFSKRQHLQLQ